VHQLINVEREIKKVNFSFEFYSKKYSFVRYIITEKILLCITHSVKYKYNHKYSMLPKQIKKTTDILKNRVEECKILLPNNWRQKIIAFAPEYDSLKGARLMDNVYKLRSSDLKLTELMEQISSENKPSPPNTEPID
jgi:hypothetical protein